VLATCAAPVYTSGTSTDFNSTSYVSLSNISISGDEATFTVRVKATEIGNVLSFAINNGTEPYSVTFNGSGFAII
jgi:hypothetical protein